MTCIRHLSIRRFRGLRQLDWAPLPGVNGLIGPGDAGKSAVLDAIALALSATRREVFFDTDFYNLDVTQGFEVRVTLSDLPDELRDVERYGDYLRGWVVASGSLEDEPSAEALDALTLQLRVGGELEGEWSLYSDRTQGQDARDLSLAHRALIAPVTLDHSPATHLRWSRQSILQRLATPQVSIRTLVAQAARGLREHAAEVNDAETDAVIAQVRATGRTLGIDKAQRATVQLDAFGIPGWNAALGLHDETGVPLRCLGTGSARLLVAGLFQTRLAPDGIALVDEIEHGLEPHRLSRLLKVLGAGTDNGPQVFLTSHSPVVLRELSARELGILRHDSELAIHEVNRASTAAQGQDAQGLVRACAEALLAPNVVVAEGPTEIGLLRGLDAHWSEEGNESFALRGLSVANGGGIPQGASRATIFGRLGYRTALFMDSDRPLSPEELQTCAQASVTVIAWGEGKATEEALFGWLGWEEVVALLGIAQATWTDEVLDEQLQAHSVGTVRLAGCVDEDTPAIRDLLSRVAKKQGWFKRMDFGERVGREVLAPGLHRASLPLRTVIAQVRAWVDGG